jgi:hypothetical protein
MYPITVTNNKLTNNLLSQSFRHTIRRNNGIYFEDVAFTYKKFTTNKRHVTCHTLHIQ